MTRWTSAFARNVKWQLASSGSQALLSGFVLLVMGRELSAAGFGVFAIVMGYVYIANLVLEPRMQDVAAKRFWDIAVDPTARARHRASIVDLFLVESLIKLIPCLALLLLAPWLVRLGNLPSSGSVLIAVAALGIYLGRLGSGLSVGLLRVLGRSDLYAFCVTADLCLRLVLTLAWAHLFGLSVLASIVILGGCAAVVNALQWLLVCRQLPGLHAGFRGWRTAEARARLHENSTLLLANLGLSVSDLMNKDMDIAVLSPLVPTEHVGIYKMAKQIALLAWRAVDPLYLALMPELNRLVAVREFTGLRRLLATVSRGLLLLGLTLGTVLYLGSVYLAVPVLGAAFADVALVMPGLLLGIVAGAPFVWGHPLAVALNRADAAFVSGAVASLIGLMALLALTSAHGIRGAALAWSITLILGVGFTAFAASRFLRRAMSEAA